MSPSTLNSPQQGKHPRYFMDSFECIGLPTNAKQIPPIQDYDGHPVTYHSGKTRLLIKYVRQI